MGHADIAAVSRPDQTLFFQLYMMKDRAKSEAALIGARQLGYKAIICTVDTPFPGEIAPTSGGEAVADSSSFTGNRELDLRTGLDENSISLDNGGKVGEKKLAIAQSSQ